MQAEVRRTMLEAGGYWRPLAAVVRLLEELGELVELLDGMRPDPGHLAGELADLWIITTALADQFRITVAEPGAGPRRAGSVSPAALVAAAGPIARVVNHYDGPKTPRATDRLPSLTEAIGRFHAELERLSAALGVDLTEAVADKLRVIRAGPDMGRFTPEDSDPSTAAVLGLLAPGAEQSRLWGAPGPDVRAPVGERAAALLPTLLAFTKAARPEGLDGYVIGAPSPPGSAELEHWLDELLEELRRRDPQGPSEFAGGLRFNGLELRVAVLPVCDRAPGGAPPAEALVLLGTGDGGVLGRPAGDRP